MTPARLICFCGPFCVRAQYTSLSTFFKKMEGSVNVIEKLVAATTAAELIFPKEPVAD